MELGMKFTSATGRLSKQRHRPVGSAILAGIIRMVGVFRAIAVEYQTAILAEESYRQLRFSCGSGLARSGLRRDQQALVIKSLFCGHEQ